MSRWFSATGGIAAYKACSCCAARQRLAMRSQSSRPNPPYGSSGRPPGRALSGRAVPTDVFTDVPSVTHVRLGQQADLIMVAPATADDAGARGAGQRPTCSGTSCSPPGVGRVRARHARGCGSTRRRLPTWLWLRERGAMVIDPAVGRLTGVDTGPGRLPDPAELFRHRSGGARWRCSGS